MGNGHEQRETTVGSRIGWQGHFLTVRIDDVRLPSGRETAREYVDHPGAVGILPITTDGHVLLIRQYRTPIKATILEIPAGTREPGEPAVETARRELIEEIAHEPGRLTELTTFYSSPGYTNERITIFRADDCRPVPKVHADEETISLVRIPLADIPALLADPSHPVDDAQALVALLMLVASPDQSSP